MNSFFQRALSGAAFVAVMLRCTIAGPVPFLLLFFVITLIGLYEYYAMVSKYGVALNKTIFFSISALITALCALSSYNNLLSIQPLPLCAALVFLYFLFELFANKDKPFLNIGASITGIIYVVLPFSLFIYLTFHTPINGYNYMMAIALFILQWSSDTFQYLFGMTLGRRKLFERISPKKSWEGFIGGLITTMCAAYFMNIYFPFYTKADWIIIAGIIVVFGTMGDLVESLLKRSVDVKDSGNIMPGHGGILDRFDGLLGSMPFVFAYIYYCT